jgi:hypothetical protein
VADRSSACERQVSRRARGATQACVAHRPFCAKKKKLKAKGRSRPCRPARSPPAWPGAAPGRRQCMLHQCILQLTSTSHQCCRSLLARTEKSSMVRCPSAPELQHDVSLFAWQWSSMPEHGQWAFSFGVLLPPPLPRHEIIAPLSGVPFHIMPPNVSPSLLLTKAPWRTAGTVSLSLYSLATSNKRSLLSPIQSYPTLSLISFKVNGPKQSPSRQCSRMPPCDVDLATASAS